MSAPTPALTSTQRAELRQNYLVAQARYEGARQMSWLLSGHGHLSPKAKEAIETEVEVLRLGSVQAWNAWQAVATAFSAALAERVATLEHFPQLDSLLDAPAPASPLSCAA